jgi:hypothetical protein
MRSWPTDVPFRPKKTTELGSEIHNARKKAPFKGSPSQKDGVLATHLDHLRQLKQLPTEFKNEGPLITPLGAVEVTDISRKALTTACRLTSWLSCNRSPSDVLTEFHSWFNANGRKILHGAADGADSDKDTLDELLADILEKHTCEFDMGGDVEWEEEIKEELCESDLPAQIFAILEDRSALQHELDEIVGDADGHDATELVGVLPDCDTDSEEDEPDMPAVAAEEVFVFTVKCKMYRAFL